MICWILKIASMVFCLLMPQANWSPFGKGIVSHASDFPVTMLIFRALHPRAVLPVLGTWPAHPSQVHTLLVPVLSTQSRLRNSIADSANYSIPFPMSQRPLPLLPPGQCWLAPEQQVSLALSFTDAITWSPLCLLGAAPRPHYLTLKLGSVIRWIIVSLSTSLSRCWILSKHLLIK